MRACLVLGTLDTAQPQNPVLNVLDSGRCFLCTVSWLVRRNSGTSLPLALQAVACWQCGQRRHPQVEPDIGHQLRHLGSQWCPGQVGWGNSAMLLTRSRREPWPSKDTTPLSTGNSPGRVWARVPTPGVSRWEPDVRVQTVYKLFSFPSLLAASRLSSVPSTHPSDITYTSHGGTSQVIPVHS